MLRVCLLLCVGAAAQASGNWTLDQLDELRRAFQVNDTRPLRAFPAAQGVSQVVSVNGRKVEIYTPAGVVPGRKTCLILAFHGVTSSPNDVELKMNMKPHLDASPAGPCAGGWLLAYPYGSSFIASFNGAGCCPTTSQDDVTHTKNIITYLEDNGQIDPRNVFVTGFSNGGFMTNRLACTLGLRADGQQWIRAVAPVAGLIGTDSRTTSECARLPDGVSLPVFAFHSLDDPTVGYYGKFPTGTALGFQAEFEKYANLNGCVDVEPSTRSSPTTKCIIATNCRSSSAFKQPVTVEFCSVYASTKLDPSEKDGLGHHWSGALSQSPRNLDLDSTQLFLEFFSSHVIA